MIVCPRPIPVETPSFTLYQQFTKRLHVLSILRAGLYVRIRRFPAVSNAVQTKDNEANHLIIYCLNCIQHGRNATYEPGLIQRTAGLLASSVKWARERWIQRTSGISSLDDCSCSLRLKETKYTAANESLRLFASKSGDNGKTSEPRWGSGSLTLLHSIFFNLQNQNANYKKHFMANHKPSLLRPKFLFLKHFITGG